METASVVSHPQSIPLRVDPPVAFIVLLPEVVLGSSSGCIIPRKLAHPSTAADVACHHHTGSFIDDQTTFNGG